VTPQGWTLSVRCHVRPPATAAMTGSARRAYHAAHDALHVQRRASSGSRRQDHSAGDGRPPGVMNGVMSPKRRRPPDGFDHRTAFRFSSLVGAGDRARTGDSLLGNDRGSIARCCTSTHFDHLTLRGAAGRCNKSRQKWWKWWCASRRIRDALLDRPQGPGRAIRW
jgi:hypothetical protein